MKKKESPDRGEPMQGNNSLEGIIKDKPILSKRQKNVYELLRTGKHSVADITIKLGYADPRSYIRYLRDKGVLVKDEVVHKDDVAFKRYWIEEPAPQRSSTKSTANAMEQSNFLDVFPKQFNH